MKKKYKQNHFTHLSVLFRATIMFLCLFATIRSARAQTVDFTAGYPQFDSNTLVMLEDERTLTIRFTALGNDVPQAKVEITLPDGISPSTVTSPTAGLTFTHMLTGRILTLTITSNGGILPKEQEFQFQVKVKADCRTEGNVAFAVKVLSGTESKGATSASINIARPNVTLLVDGSGIISYNTPTDEKEVSYFLRTTTVDQASSAKITFTVNEHVTLANFKLNGTAFTPTVTTGSGERTYTYAFTSPATMGGNKITNANDKKITFTAKGSTTICGQQTVRSTIQFPHNIACGAIGTGPNVILNMSVAGNPTFTPEGINYINSMPPAGTVTAAELINMDGTTPTYLKAVFRNGTQAAARTFSCELRTGTFGYIDTSKVYLQVNNGPLRKISAHDIAITGRLTNNTSHGYLKPSAAGKPARIAIRTVESVPTGSTLTFYAATINGNIRDNETKDVFDPVYYISINDALANLFDVTGFCNNTNNTRISQQISGFNFTHYQEKPNTLSFKGTATKTQIVKVAPGSIKQAPAIFTVETPVWLTITDLKLTPDALGTGTLPAGVTANVTNHGTNKRSVKVVSTGATAMVSNCYLHVTYSSQACGIPPTNQQDVVWYTAKQEWTGGVIYKISQVSQTVHHICTIEGIEMDTFYLHRTTKGFKDSDNNGEPDGNTPALDNEINHNLYLIGDDGYFEGEGTITTSGGPYKYLYIPIKVGGSLTIGEDANRYINLLNATGRTITINGTPTSLPVKYISKGEKNGYFQIHQAGGFPSGSKVKIKIPFKTKSPSNNSISGTIENGFCVSENSIADPFDTTDPNRKGSSVAVTNVTIANIVSYVNPPSGNNITFTTRAPQSNTLFSFINFYSTTAFDREVRLLAYPKRITIKLPIGYSIDDSLNIHRYSATGEHKKIVHPISGSATREITWDLGTIYQTTDIAGSLTGGKWRLPEEIWRGIYPKGTIRVNPSAAGFEATSDITISCEYWDPVTDQPYKNPHTGENLIRQYTYKLIYNFDVKLEPSSSTITSYGITVAGPQITMRNNGSSELKDVYYYFDGPIKNVSMRQTVGGSTIYPHSSTSPNHNGCWVKVANLPGNTTHTYQLTYTDLQPNCSGNTVKIYTGSGFSSTWTPNTAQPYNPLNDPNFVEQTQYRIIPSNNVQIANEIILLNPAKRDTVPEGAISTNNYTIRTTFSTASSEGMVKNLEMTLTVPVGQLYVPGSAQIEYPLGTFQSVPTLSTLETVLRTLATGEDTQRSVRLKLNDSGIAAIGPNFILPGFRSYSTDADSIYQKARLHMKFRAMCNTNFRGMNYKSTVYGKSICNNEAEGNGNTISSHTIYPDVVFNYRFGEIDIRSTSQSYAFNEGRQKDTLILHVRRILGPTSNMSANDYLEVLIPPQLNIDGDTIQYKGTGTMAALNRLDAVIENAIIAHARRLKLPFPINEYNAASGKGVNAPIQCRIPVVYTPNRQERAVHPIDSIQATIWSELQFGGCTPVPTDFGSGKRNIALFTAVQCPHIAWIGDTARFEITSHGFDGKWYKEKTGGIVESSNNPWINIPTDTAMVGDTVFYFSPIINGNSYGDIRLPYPVRIWLRPWFIKNLDTMKYVCTDHDTLRVKAGGMDVSYRWYKDGDSIAGATDTFLVIREPGKYYVLVNDTVTPPNIISSDTMNVYFREFPIITKELKAPRRDCDRLSYDLEVGTQGHHLLYQWYRNGLPISGANQRSYRALAKDSSAFYRVTVKNLCGDSISSKQCYISFCDEKISGIGRRIELIVPNTAETNPPARGIIYVSSQQDFVFTIKAKKGYSVKYLHVNTDSPIWTEFSGGIQRTMISDSVMQVRIRTVTSNLKVTLSGITPLSNMNITEQVQKVWAHKDKLYVETERNETVYIYTVMGQLYKREDVQAGLNAFGLESGYYVIRFADGHSHKVFIE